MNRYDDMPLDHSDRSEEIILSILANQPDGGEALMRRLTGEPEPEARQQATYEQEQSTLQALYHQELSKEPPIGTNKALHRQAIRRRFQEMGLRGVDGLPGHDGMTQEQRQAARQPVQQAAPVVDQDTLKASYLSDVERARNTGGMEMVRQVRLEYRRRGLNV